VFAIVHGELRDGHKLSKLKRVSAPVQKYSKRRLKNPHP